MKAANSILVVGGGVVGVEIMGELVSSYPTKKLGLCQRGNRLLSVYSQKAHTLADRFFRERNVNLHYNSTYKKDSAEWRQYDLVINCSGFKYRSEFMNRNFKQCISPSGEIYVNSHMQITNVDPTTNPNSRAAADNIFCLGDAAKTRLQNAKTILTLRSLAPYIYRNIVRLSQGQSVNVAIPSSLPTLCLCSLGPDFALFIMNGMVMLNPTMGQKKNEMHRDTVAAFTGDHKKYTEGIKQLNGIRSMLSCITCCCCCCPCSNCFTVVK